MPRKTASLPASQNSFKGAMVGCKPSVSLRGMTWSCGIPRWGRKSRYRPLVYGITVFRPSLPPDRDSTTKTLSCEAIVVPPLQSSCLSAELEFSSRSEHLEHLATLTGEV